MGRIVKDWKPDRVEDAEIAPHRYTWDASSDYQDARELKAFLAGVPYKAGEVVYVERAGHGEYVARKARILFVTWDREHRERTGERREMYRVQFETGAGLWSKLWEYVHPGHVQRGYKLAGLAPDVH